MTSQPMASQLERFSAWLQAADAEVLAGRTLAWASEQRTSLSDLLDRRFTSSCAVASVFASVCAPADPSARCLDIAARFLLLFLSTDGADQRLIPDQNTTDSGSWDIGPFSSALNQWMDEFWELREASLPDTERFYTAYQGYIQARKREPLATAADLTVAEHWESRRKTIFVEPFVSHWVISTRSDTSSLDQKYIDDLIVQTSDLVWLANDIGSFGRVENDGETEDLNIINTLQRCHDQSEEEALEQVIDTYNDTAKSFECRANELLSAGTVPACTLVDILQANIDGNLRSMELLAFRYPRLEAANRLRRVRRSLRLP